MKQIVNGLQFTVHCNLNMITVSENNELLRSTFPNVARLLFLKVLDHIAEVCS